MKGYEGLAAALVAEGIEIVFGLIGGNVDELTRILADQRKVKFVPVRHEEVAVGMADGYSRATGKIGVAIVCSGPGLANSCAPMLAARMSKSKLLVIVGANSIRSRHDNMDYDQQSLLEATIGELQPCRAPTTLSEDVALAFRHIRLGRGPVALHFSQATSELPPNWEYNGKNLSRTTPEFIAPRNEDIRDIAERLLRCRRPVLLAGRGSFLAEARAALIELADRSGALLATTLLTKNWLDGDPFNIGLSGGFSTADQSDILSQSDLVVAFGASLNDHTLDHGRLFRNAVFVQVDTTPAAFDDYVHPDKAVLADAKATAQALLMALDRIDRPDWRGPAMATRIRNMDRWRNRDMIERPGCANPRRVIDALDRLAPKDRILVIDIGLFMGVPATYMSVPSPADIIFPWQLGRVGCALPVALGAAVGRSDRLVTVFVGDGGLMASLHSLDTLRAQKLPMLIIVMDDGGFGAERHIFEMKGEQTHVADYDTPDVVALASALSMQGFKVSSSSEMTDLLQNHDLRHSATLIQVIMDRRSQVDEMDAAIYKTLRPH